MLNYIKPSVKFNSIGIKAGIIEMRQRSHAKLVEKIWENKDNEL